MVINNSFYIEKLNSCSDDTRNGIVDYIFSFLRRRGDINKDIPVDIIRRHCEQTLGVKIPMDALIGALLYSRYVVRNSDGQWYAGINWDSPIGKMILHERIDRITLQALHGWYGDLIDPATGERYNLQ